MKVKKFDLGHLYNEEWLTYEAFVVKALTPEKAAPNELVTLRGLLEANAAQAALAIEVIRTSEYTRRLDEADARRDRLVSAVYSSIRACAHDDDAPVRDLALTLQPVLDHYAGLAKENRDQESSRIVSFVADLRERLGQRASMLPGLDRRLTQLAMANADYVRLQDEGTYAAAAAAQATPRMADVRREGDRLLRAIWSLVDVLLLVNPTPGLEAMAAQLAEENQRVRTRLATRKTEGERRKGEAEPEAES